MVEIAVRDETRNKLPSGMLTVQEVARLLYVHANTVRKWSNLGLLKTYRIGRRGDRRFAVEEVSEFLRVNSQSHSP